MNFRDPEPKSWDNKSRSVRFFFDWLTMRDMRYVIGLTGGGLSLLFIIVALSK